MSVVQHAIDEVRALRREIREIIKQNQKKKEAS